ncbi:hypothetical protein PWT90_00293 [Aphanocladium album]|nr:hypothetical protein PWT90_00293 [Aphanocladium album]
MPEQTPEPIAIVGSACRFPGGANSPAKLWELLKAPRDLAVDIPPERFDLAGYYHPDGSHHGATNVRQSYLLDENIRRFDSMFFNISPNEADSMDPQQRLLLETVYEALESGGHRIDVLRGSNTAVYTGTMSVDYSDTVLRDLSTVPTYFGTGANRAIISNRISYFFDWHGPSMTIDTACSSSLIAIHMGVKSLRTGESRVALGCGTQIILNPETYVMESKLNMLSPTSRSRMWDADADGYARGEGVAAIVMKRLSDALADGDHIDCIIRETGTNQDGHSNGITVPSTEAQAALIRQTYARAGLFPEKNAKDRPQFFEAHGTGTKAGDPKEAAAIHQIFGSGTGKNGESPLYVGSIKTVIGHLEGSAGIAGVLKASAMVRHGVVYPNLLFKHLNPDIIPFYNGLHVPTEQMPWPQLPNGVPRRVSVNSFGFGGSNAHAIIEQWPGTSAALTEKEAIAPATSGPTTVIPFTFSAQSQSSLVAQLQSYSKYLEKHTKTKPGDLAWTLKDRKTEFSHKCAFAASSLDQLKEKIDATLLKRDENQESNIGVRAKTGQPGPKIMAVFTGQGAQWPSMGAQLLQTSEFVRKRVLELEEALATLPPDDRPSWKLGEEILAEGETSRVSSATISQPLCTAIQIVLVDLLRAAGVRFSTVVGHSSGEIAAAYTAHFISAQDAIRIAYYRGLVLHNAGSGAMMATGTSWEDATELVQLRALRGRVTVAAHNSAASVTLSGDVDGIAKAKEILDEEKKFARLLKVDKAYHSHHMLPCGDAYIDALRSCIAEPSPRLNEQCSWYSSVFPSSKPYSSPENLQATYWRDNLTSPVLFAEAVKNAVASDDQIGLVLEIGPHPALKGPAIQNISDVRPSTIPYSGTLNRGLSDIDSLSNALGFLWTHLGSRNVDFKAYSRAISQQLAKPQLVVGLPSYQWDHTRDHWSESRRSRRMRSRKQPAHELLGILAPDSTATDLRWTNVLKESEIPWLHGHKLQGQTVFPAAGYVAMALEAATAIVPPNQSICQFGVSDFSIDRAITFENANSSAVETLVTLQNLKKEESTIGATFSCYALPVETAGVEADLDRVASCAISITLENDSIGLIPFSRQNEYKMTDIDSERFYHSLSELGYNYSGPFRKVHTMRRTFRNSMGIIDGFEYNDLSSSKYLIHPCTLDMAFQLAILASSAPGDGELWSLHVPTSIESIRVDARLNSMVQKKESALKAYANLEAASKSFSSHVDLINADTQECVVRIENLSIKPFAPATKSDDRVMFTSTKLGLAGPDGSCIVQGSRPSLAEVEAARACERISYYYQRKWKSEITDAEWLSGPSHYILLRNWINHTISRAMAGNHPSLEKDWSDDSEEDIKALASKHWDQVDIRLLTAVGENMPASIRGETTILEHMTTDNKLDEYYEKGPGLSTYHYLLASMAKQITFRYPQAKFIEIGAGTGGATKPVLEAVHDTIASYTYTDISRGFFEKAAETFSSFKDKMIFNALDIEKPPESQGYEPHSYDVAIAFNVLHATQSLQKTLTHVRQLVKPGGYLLLLEFTNNDPIRFGTTMAGLPGWWLGANDGRSMQPTVTTREWHSVLRKSGFSGVDTETPEIDGLTWPISILVSQAVDDRVQLLRRPLSAPMSASSAVRIQSLVILGTGTLISSKIAEELDEHLSRFCDEITVLQALPTKTETQNISPLSVFINLVDLDSPIFKDITEAKMEALKDMYDSAKQVLWITHGALSEKPYHMASIAFNRTVRREARHVSLNHLDFSNPEKPGVSKLIAEHLLRICALDEWTSDDGARDSNQFLWSKEPEAFQQGDQLMLPRLVPENSQNNRLNARRRIVRKTFEPVSPTTNLHIVDDSATGQHDLAEFPMLNVEHTIKRGTTFLNTESSSLMALRLANDLFMFVVAGIDNRSGERVIGFSDTRALRTSPFALMNLRSPQAKSMEINTLVCNTVCELAARAIIHSVAPGSRLLMRCAEEEDLFARTLAQRAKANGIHLIFIQEREVSGGSLEALESIRISCQMSKHDARRTLHSAHPTHFLDVVDIAEGGRHACMGQLDQFIIQNLPKDCMVLHPNTYFQRQSRFVRSGNNIELVAQLEQILQETDLETIDASTALASKVVIPVWKIPEPRRSVHGTCVISWATEVPIEAAVAPLDAQRMFSPERTYVLFGISGQIGQSLCEFMVANGAGCVCLTSRRPNIDERWLASFQQTSSKVKVFSMDVTDKKAVENVVNDIRANCPPIAGVAHGAMVLSDTLFSKMTTKEMTTVLGPKILGAIHLDEIFSKDELDFFVLFSSVSCVMGNVGQSNYAAANGYLNGLARQRRKRGLAASIFDIGRVAGLGYIETVSQGLLDQLLALGLQSISESDLHQAFAETILMGYSRADDQFVLPEAVLTTGIRRFRFDEDVKGPWFSNPLFSHLVIASASAQIESASGGDQNKAKSLLRISQQISTATSIGEAAAALQDCFSHKLQAILQIFDHALDPQTPLVELGIDSLVAVEVRSWFLKELKVDVPVLKIVGGTSLAELCSYVLEKLPSELTGTIGNQPAMTKSSDQPSITGLLKAAEGFSLASSIEGSQSPPSSSGVTLASSRASRAATPFSANTTSESSTKACSEISDEDKRAASPTRQSSNKTVIKKVPISFAQSRYWFLHHLLDQKTSNVAFYYHVEGKLRADDLGKALRAVCARHEALRTCFVAGDEDATQAYQSILSRSPVTLTCESINDPSEVQARFEKLRKHVFDLASGELLQMVLLTMSPTSHYLLVHHHHILMDGFSVRIFLSDLEKLYEKQSIGSTPHQYPEFSVAQRQEFENGDMVNELEYWRGIFPENSPPTTLPLLPMARTSTRTAMTAYDTHEVHCRLSPELAAKIRQVSKMLHATPFHFYLAAFHTLLFRFTETNELVVGMADAARNGGEMLNSIGFYLNLLALRFQWRPHSSFTEAISDARTVAHSALERSRLPFDVLLTELGFDRSAAHSPLFQAFIDYRQGSPEKQSWSDCQFEMKEWHLGKTAYDVTVDVTDTMHDAVIMLRVQKSLYDIAAANVLLETYAYLLEGFASDPSTRLDRPSLFTEKMTESGLRVGQGPLMLSTWPETLVHRIEEIAFAHPGNIALKDSSPTSLTYSAMMCRVEALSQVLHTAGITKGDHVLVLQKPSVDWVCCLLAIMRIGAVYVPMDTRSPVMRLSAQAIDCAPAAVMVDATTISIVSQLGIPQIKHIDIDEVPAVPTPGFAISNKAQGTAAAAILYTSGSTGTPKGIVISHAGLLNEIEGYTKTWELKDEHVLQQSAFTFDFASDEIFTGLVNGGTVFVASAEERSNPVEIANIIQQQRITYTRATPSEYLHWFQYGRELLRQADAWRFAFAGGEKLTSVVLQEFQKLQNDTLRLFNSYGPAETSISSCKMEVKYNEILSEEAVSRIPCGYSLPNYHTFILDEKMAPQPIGTPGEICIGGAGVSMGYLNNTTLSDKQFVSNPFASEHDIAQGWTRMYRTGDIGHFNPDGSLVFRGRVEGDTQVKIRGMRVDLADIESNILFTASGALKEAVVTLREEKTQFLVAHVVFRSLSSAPEQKLFLQRLLSRLPLPQYMIPVAAFPIAELPLTNHSKVDRKAILDMELPHDADKSDGVPSAHMTETMWRLSRLWKDIIGARVLNLGADIGPSTNFFHVGGNSLLIILLQSKLRQEFGVAVPLIELLNTNSLLEMGKKVDEACNATTIDWDLETSLPEISASLAETICGENDQGRKKTILITGATGFLGRHLLKTFIESPTVARIHCAALRQRQRDDMQDLPVSEKITWHRGDLTAPLLGLGQDAFCTLAAEVNIILHLGASRSIWDSYHVLRASNVHPTRELIKMAAPRRVPIYFISTAGASAASSPRLAEAYPVPLADSSDGYTATKWASERLLARAQDKFGVPSKTYRFLPAAERKPVTQSLLDELVQFAKASKTIPDAGRWSGLLFLTPLNSFSSKICADLLSEKASTGTEAVNHECQITLSGEEMIAEISSKVSTENLEKVAILKWFGKLKKSGFEYLIASHEATVDGVFETKR